MKKHIAIAAAILLAGSGCKKEAEVEAPVKMELDSIEKKVSYVIGYDTARRMQTEGFEIDADVVRVAIDDLKNGKDPMMSDEEMHAAMTAFQAQIQEKRQASFNKQAEENLQQGQAFLAENAKREGVITTESGLQYEIITAGTGESPAVTDNVSVNYKGTLITGEVFDSGEGVSFRIDQLIPGWVEALPLMKVGAKWKLFIPSELAYGQGGSGSIGPNSPLIFEMELLGINKDS